MPFQIETASFQPWSPATSSRPWTRESKSSSCSEVRVWCPPSSPASSMVLVVVMTGPLQAGRLSPCPARRYTPNASNHMLAFGVCQELCHDPATDRKSTRLNSSHVRISYAVFCLKKKKKKRIYYVVLLKNKPKKINKT